MTPFQRYLAEEVAEDHADGLIPRREALSRLALLGLGLPAAAALLAACGAPEENAATPPSAPPAASTPPVAASPAGPAPLPTEEITFPGPEGRLMGAFASAAAEPRGAVLVVHENRGLNDHTRSVAGRLAAEGYSALAIDLLSREGGTTALGESGQVSAALSAAAPERFAADMKAGLDELERRAPGAKLGAVGFCFGGGMVWLLLSSGESRLAAGVPFYGPLPDGADFAGTEAAVLGIYGEDDARVNATRDAAKAALDRAGLTSELVTYPGAGHAFFNETGARYNPQAAGEAYQKLTEWFGEHLAG
ncbi:carboxymethylenebutenolidase [Acrocarpospora corrugata]|uniref:Carboxymethylenebutenolidase n=1 Tax=Acrocarpospora corrugata TaxID=35763 RepID=A0A5M3W3D0_9ACTN|nr:dienelactone hydrolase family protein [Acrocarpospora corrugata]GES01793.1 carboxymethylenebutenolidase [Acrocarpospora corrugata]